MTSDRLQSLGIEPVGAAFKAPTMADLQQVQKLLAAPLPPDFHEFLMRFGSSRFNGDAYVKCSTGDKSVAEFYGGARDADLNLLSMLKTYTGRVPPGMLPFARSVFGDQFLLDVAAEKPGRVFFWDHRREFVPPRGQAVADVPLSDWQRNVTLVAPAFSAFLKKLYIEKPKRGEGRRLSDAEILAKMEANDRKERRRKGRR